MTRAITVKKPQKKTVITQADEGMAEELRETCLRIKQIDAEADVEELQQRYEAASALHELLGGARQQYGERVNQRIAVELSWSEEKLRLYVRVVEVYNEAAIQSMVAEKKKHESDFCWSHVVLLAGVADGRVRNRLRTQALSKSVSSPTKGCRGGRSSRRRAGDAN